MVFRLLYAPQVSPILLFISSSVCNRLPTYLHFFQFSDPSLLMLNFSVFASFTNKFLLFNVLGIYFSILFIICIPVDAHPISSAYC